VHEASRRRGLGQAHHTIMNAEIRSRFSRTPDAALRPPKASAEHLHTQRRPSIRFFVVLATLVFGFVALACNPARPSGSPASERRDLPPERSPHTIDIFAFGRFQGTIAPCGCTSVPLGGLQHAMGYIAAGSSAGQRLILEPGSLLFPDPDGSEAPDDGASWAQAEQRADLLVKQLSRFGQDLVSGLGPTDFSSAHGTRALSRWKLPRVLTNASSPLPEAVLSHRVADLGHGVQAAIMVVVDPRDRGPEDLDFPALEAPKTALRSELRSLREAHKGSIQLRIAIVHGPAALAMSLARELPELDLVVVAGKIDNVDRGRSGSPVTRIETKHPDGAPDVTWVMQPGDRGQTLTHLRLSMDAATSVLSPPETWVLLESDDQVAEQLRQVERRLKKFESDPDADPGFIARIRAERAELKQLLGEKRRSAAPVTAEFRQVAIDCTLATDGQTKKALHGYDGWVATANQKRFAGVKAPKAAQGQAAYVGTEECSNCHDEAAEFWKTTVHARAYETLVAANKQFDLSCVGCHVTGFRAPGGSEVVENEGLRDVQCEQCHGPGSLHADDDAIPLKTAVPADLCLQCHTPEHSDTFEYDAYLRDILGEGHGQKKRSQLGDGPTAHALRAAALAKAAACPKM